MTVGTIDNSNGGTVVTMGGAVAMLMSDLFSSVTTNPAFSFAIFDNVQVFSGLVPLPSAILPGDYNDDDIVNAADYASWRDHLGSPTSLPNDSTTGVDAGDYGVWRANFGATPGAGSGFTTVVPEPSLIAMVALFGLFCLFAMGRSDRLAHESNGSSTHGA